MNIHAPAGRFAGRGASRPADSALTAAEMDERGLIHFGPAASHAAGAFLELRTRLRAISTGRLVVLVAPVSTGSGGSHVARNLAVAMTFDEHEAAVLVDCDLRHPSQQATLRIAPVDGGLADYLDDARRSPGSLLHDTGVPRLQLLPAGAPREADAGHFSTAQMSTAHISTARMRQLVDTLRDLHPDRHVVLDSPPVRGGPDARSLGEVADVVVLVAGNGRDTPSAIAQAAGAFDPGRFAGVVFNEGV